MNFLSCSAKLAIWLTRRNRAQSAGSAELVPVLEELLRVEFAYYKMMDNMQSFSHIWAFGGVLSSVGGKVNLL